MKSIRNLSTATLLAAGAALTAAAGMLSASAADDPATAPATASATAPAAPPGPAGMHRRGGEWRLLSRLGLTDDQKAQIKSIMTAARPQMHSLHEQMRANALKLRQTQPTDPNYASIASQTSQTHGSLSAEMMGQRAAVRAQVFKVLTPAQQSELTALEAQMQSRKHGSWGGPHE